ncbi:unnamed protein product, partial [marine sediment metagenome]
PKKMDLIVGGSDTIDSVTACYEVKGYEVDINLDECLFLTSDSEVATVEKITDNTTVTVTAEGAGTANILVSYGGKIDTLKVTVIAKALDHIIVHPDEMTFTPLSIPRLITSVTAYYNNGDIEEITDFAEEDCTFTSSNPDYVTVDEDGMVTRIAAQGGSTIETTITVSYEGETDIIDVTVEKILILSEK